LRDVFPIGRLAPQRKNKIWVKKIRENGFPKTPIVSEDVSKETRADSSAPVLADGCSEPSLDQVPVKTELTVKENYRNVK